MQTDEREEDSTIIYISSAFIITAIILDFICIFYIVSKGCCSGKRFLILPKNYKVLTCIRIIMICSVFLASFSTTPIIKYHQSTSISGILFCIVSLLLHFGYFGLSMNLSIHELNLKKAICKFYILFFISQSVAYFWIVFSTIKERINDGLFWNHLMFHDYDITHFSILLLIPYTLCFLESVSWLKELNRLENDERMQTQCTMKECNIQCPVHYTPNFKTNIEHNVTEIWELYNW